MRSDGWQRQQGDPGGQPGQGPGGPHHPGRQKIVNLTLATSETWNDRASGERKERTEWHRVVIFNDRIADVAERFLRKGRKIYVEGALQTRKWTDQSGPGALHHRGGDRPLPRRADHAGQRRRRVRAAARARAAAIASERPRRSARRAVRQRRWRRPVVGRAEGRRPGRRNPVLARPPGRSSTRGGKIVGQLCFLPRRWLTPLRLFTR